MIMPCSNTQAELDNDRPGPTYLCVKCELEYPLERMETLADEEKGCCEDCYIGEHGYV